MGNPDTRILQEYAPKGSPVKVVPEWSLPIIWKAITKRLHTSTVTDTTTDFWRTEILERSLWGFRIVLIVEDAICLFSTLLRTSRLELV